jgi:hypothetical protein
MHGKSPVQVIGPLCSPHAAIPRASQKAGNGFRLAQSDSPCGRFGVGTISRGASYQNRLAKIAAHCGTDRGARISLRELVFRAPRSPRWRDLLKGRDSYTRRLAL